MIQIEDAKAGYANSGMVSQVVAEARIRKDEGKVTYVGVVELEGILSFYHSEESRYEKEIENCFDSEEIVPADESYEGYLSFYYALYAMEDQEHALLLKYLVALCCLSHEEAKKLKRESIGKAIGSFDIPVTIFEKEYLEEQEEYEDDEDEEDDDDEDNDDEELEEHEGNGEQ